MTYWEASIVSKVAISHTESYLRDLLPQKMKTFHHNCPTLTQDKQVQLIPIYKSSAQKTAIA